ncbi:MAG TPA: hypothetical protein VNF47_11065 [Streptosporangiaceae bacterium]|nr:hypothetical protein [Streptosporangiaceae bacterium]
MAGVTGADLDVAGPVGELGLAGELDRLAEPVGRRWLARPGWPTARGKGGSGSGG